MTAAPVSHYYTADDLLTMPDGEHFELWDGELKELCMGSESNWVGMKVNGALFNFVSQSDLGTLFMAELSLQIVPGRPNRIPRVDGAFVAKDRLPTNRPPKGHLTIAPDLVLEVVSPNDSASHLAMKVRLFLDCGVRLVWVVDPQARTATIYRADGSVSLIRKDGSLDGETVLPGFSLPLASVLPEPMDETDD
jgi:Uma2 family endonuclease